MQMSIACNLIPMGDRLDSDPTVDFLDKDVLIGKAGSQRNKKNIIRNTDCLKKGYTYGK